MDFGLPPPMREGRGGANTYLPVNTVVRIPYSEFSNPEEEAKEVGISIPSFLFFSTRMEIDENVRRDYFFLLFFLYI